MKHLLTLSLCCLLLQPASAQKGRGYLILDAAPKLCLTQNSTTTLYSNRISRAGAGFDAHIGYGRTFPKLGAFAEWDLGYARYRLSPDADQMDFYLDPNAFSHAFDFLQTSLKLGFLHKVPALGIILAPYAGIRWLLYLPDRDKTRGEWTYVHDERVTSRHLLYARYAEGYGNGAIQAFVLTAGIKVQYPVSKRLTLTAAPYFDMGFKVLHENVYTSERQYDGNYSNNSTLTATSKGDSFGLALGVQFRPGR